MFCVDVVELKKKMIECHLEKNIDLAEAAGIDRNTVTSILTLTSRPSTVVMEKIAMALGMTPEEAGKIFFAKNLRNT